VVLNIDNIYVLKIYLHEINELVFVFQTENE